MTRRTATPRGLRHTVVILCSIGLAAVITGCGDQSDQTAPGEPSAVPSAVPVTGLPADPAAATTELRAQMIEAWLPIVRELPTPVEKAVFSVLPGDKTDTTKGDLWAAFGEQPKEQWASLESELAVAAGKAGWSTGPTKGSIATITKGPFTIAGKCSDGLGCVWEMNSTDIAQKLDAQLYLPPKDAVLELNAPKVTRTTPGAAGTATTAPTASAGARTGGSNRGEASTAPLRRQTDTASPAPH